MDTAVVELRVGRLERVSLTGVSVQSVITDAMCDRIEPPMPTDPIRGRRWADHGRTLEAFAGKFRTCSPRRDLPEEFGPLQTVHKRLTRWAVNGTWKWKEAPGAPTRHTWIDTLRRRLMQPTAYRLSLFVPDGRRGGPGGVDHVGGFHDYRNWPQSRP
ncbi:transposase [Streptomyces sp. NPDC087538]|uniref:transposase n=1 Tax=Streptomyces sp. NPDC087538 TaxID=3365797 RepID=UPI0038002BF1